MEQQHEQAKAAASRHANVDLNGENANIDLNGGKTLACSLPSPGQSRESEPVVHGGEFQNSNHFSRFGVRAIRLFDLSCPPV